MVVRSNKSRGDELDRRIVGTRLFGVLISAMVLVSVVAFDPLGWDQSGPIRWMAVPTLGFAMIALSIETTRFDGPDRQPAWRNPAHLWAGLLVWGLLATLLSADPLHAWVGTPDRRFGWLIWLLCGGLFLVARGLNPDRSEPVAMRTAKAVAVASLGLGLFTVAELAGLATEVEFAGNRAGGPFSQPAYLGAAAVLVLPIAAAVMTEHRRDRVWGSIGLGGTVGAGFALLASQSRAAWLGALAATLVWLAVRSTGNGESPKPAQPAVTTGPKSATSTATLMVVLAAPVLSIVAVPSLRARLTSSFGASGVVRGRADEWQVGLRALADAPLFGYGPEGYRTVFGRHVDQQYVIDWGRDVITDRAHSGVLDVGLVFGIPGALFYVGLMMAVVLGAFRAIGSGRPLAVGLGISTLAYTIQQQFFFPLSEIDPLFWTIAGLTFALPRSHTADSGATDSTAKAVGGAIPRQLARGLATGLAAVALAAGLADMAANISIRNVDSANAGISQADSATTLRPDSIRYRFIASRLASQSGDLDQAINHIEQALRRSSDDPALRDELTGLLLERARATTTEPERAERLTGAISALQSLTLDDPNHPDYQQRLGIGLALVGDFDGATTAIERAITLAPDRAGLGQNLSEIERLRTLEQPSG